jgi:GTP-binding protein HflX
VLLSDTVGFISRLPVSLVASFKSTLLEASEADLLLHVIDISDENFEERITTVNGVLEEIGAGDIPILPIFNKIDLKNDPDLYRAILSRYPGAHFISAVTKEGLPRLIADLETYLERSRVTIELSVDASDGRVLKLINSLAYIVESRATDETIELKARLPKSRLGKLKGQGVEFRVIEEVNGAGK